MKVMMEKGSAARLIFLIYIEHFNYLFFHAESVKISGVGKPEKSKTYQSFIAKITRKHRKKTNLIFLPVFSSPRNADRFLK